MACVVERHPAHACGLAVVRLQGTDRAHHKEAGRGGGANEPTVEGSDDLADRAEFFAHLAECSRFIRFAQLWASLSECPGCAAEATGNFAQQDQSTFTIEDHAADGAREVWWARW